jgi:uncharacterized protein (DUF1778 family)
MFVRMTKTTQVSVKLSADQREFLEAAASSDERSMAGVIRRLINSAREEATAARRAAT